jgi:hypothetical protein
LPIAAGIFYPHQSVRPSLGSPPAIRKILLGFGQLHDVTGGRLQGWRAGDHGEAESDRETFASSRDLPSRRRLIFLVGTASYNLERIIRQWWLQRFRFVPRRARIQTSHSSCVVRITGMALGWIGSIIAFGAVVREAVD